MEINKNYYANCKTFLFESFIGEIKGNYNNIVIKHKIIGKISGNNNNITINNNKHKYNVTLDITGHNNTLNGNLVSGKYVYDNM